MKSLARFAVQKRWFVLAVWLVVAIGMNLAAQSFGNNYSNSFSLPGTNSVHALKLLESAHLKGAGGDADQIVFQATSGTVADHAAAITAVLNAIAQVPEVGSVTSPFCPSGSTPSTCLGYQQTSRDGTIAYAVVHFTTDPNALLAANVSQVIHDANSLNSSGLRVSEGGQAIGKVTTPQGSPDTAVGLAVAAVVLLVAFGSLMAMLLPLGVALFAILIASAATTLLSHWVTIAQFAPILGSLIGLGVGIDYALFIVTRARQNLRQGMSVEDAVVKAIDTSGRAVMFAGATVCVALLGMLFLGFSFLSGLGIAASTTVIITMLASLTLLPALLGFWKSTVLSRRERRALAANGPEGVVVEGPWKRWAEYVSRRPKILSLLAVVAILIISLPVLTLRLGLSDQGSDPAGSTTRLAYETLAKGFGAGSNGPLQVVGSIKSPADVAAMQALDHLLATEPDVASVSPVIPVSASVAFINLVPSSAPQAAATTNLIATIRSTYVPSVTTTSHTAIYVGGATALGVDFASILDSKIPLFLMVIVILGCLLLMIAFRSILVPLVAAAMNLLAVAASFGLVVAVFQWGWGSSLIGSGSGPVESYLPIIMIAILFGLSMDYQVFLVSRMHEEWNHTGDNELAITYGQANTGRVITAAALIMIAVFFSFAFGGQRIIAEFGIGLGGAVLIDAFILRTVLVPALMHFIGKANWWIPTWLDRVIPKVALEAAE
jgi:RND superfamily putative drug exporter